MIGILYTAFFLAAVEHSDGRRTVKRVIDRFLCLYKLVVFIQDINRLLIAKHIEMILRLYLSLADGYDIVRVIVCNLLIFLSLSSHRKLDFFSGHEPSP